MAAECSTGPRTHVIVDSLSLLGTVDGFTGFGKAFRPQDSANVIAVEIVIAVEMRRNWRSTKLRSSSGKPGARCTVQMIARSSSVARQGSRFGPASSVLAGLLTTFTSLAGRLVPDGIWFRDDPGRLRAPAQFRIALQEWFALAGGSTSSQHLVTDSGETPRVLRDGPSYLFPMTFLDQTASGLIPTFGARAGRQR
jgi:hypothetical protein